MATVMERVVGSARKATMAGLSLVMAAGGVVGTAGTALAATSGKTGSVKITQVSNIGATYDGYQIVQADVEWQDDKDMGSRFEWQSAAVKSAVLTFLDSADTGATQSYSGWLQENGHTEPVNGVSAHDNPQNAVEYIAAMVEASQKADGTSTTPDTKKRNTFVDKFAQAIKAAGINRDALLETGQAQNLDQGYWLFTTTGATIAEDEVGTAPMFVAVGDRAKDIQEKSAIPTVEKLVKEDKTETWGKVADANKDQEVSFQLTGTLPTNIDAFSKYHFQFNDQLPAGMSLKGNNTSSVVVTLYANASATSGRNITGKATITYENDKLTVNIPDLYAMNETFNKDSVIRVEYDAHHDADCVIGQAGHDNVVTLTYTGDPSTPPTPDQPTRGDEDTSPKKTKVTTYQLKVDKVDGATRESLQGAKFTIQATAGGQTDTASVGKYLQADGSLSATPYEFETGADGSFSVPRIDEGVYTVHETKAPNGYELLTAANGDSDVVITVEATKDQTTGTVTALTMTASGGNGGYLGNGQGGMQQPGASGSVQNHEDGVLQADVSSGNLRFRVSNDKEIHLPGTGLTPKQAGTIAGFAMLVAGVGVVFIRQRKNAMDAE